MHEIDKKKMIQRYAERIAKGGHGPAALGEPKQRQAFYFDFLLQVPGFGKNDSILDIGCGYGDLFDYARSKGWNGNYIGIDINPDLISEGRRRYQDADLRVVDLQEDNFVEEVDWCFACSSLFNNTDGEPFLNYMSSMTKIMWNISRRGIVFNQLSPLVDYSQEIHARPSISDIIDIVSQITNRFSIRHDYMPFEYAVYAFKENLINRDRLIFAAQDQYFDHVTGSWDRHRSKR